MRPTVPGVIVLMLPLFAGSWGCDAAPTQSDPASDGDTDTDADTDTDTDTDTDADADTDTDADTEWDTFTGEGIEEARSTVAYEAEPVIEETDYSAHLDALNGFGFSVLSQLNQAETNPSNVVFSPTSITVALSMAHAGAAGETANQIAEVLNSTLPEEQFYAANNRLLLDLAARDVAPHAAENGEGEKEVRLSLVNSTWTQYNYALRDDYLDRMARSFNAGAKLVDFAGAPDRSRQLINDWVFEQTEEKIEDLLPPDAVTSQTRVVLTNALYFYGSWDTPFDTELTEAGDFQTAADTTVSVPFMHGKIETRYCDGDDYQMLDLFYDGGMLRMTLILPDAGQFEAVRDSWSTERQAAADAALLDYDVTISLPKFTFTYGSLSLKNTLMDLGMTDAFDEMSADFTRMRSADDLFVSDVVHKAFIGVDEYGTEAAAATAVIMVTLSIGPEPAEFTADRPFLFLIRDRSGAVLFMGQVTDPS